MSQLDPTIDQLLLDLDASRERVSTLLRSVYDDQDWQPNPEEWSFRYIAAHMAQVEQDAVFTRISIKRNTHSCVSQLKGNVAIYFQPSQTDLLLITF